MPFIVITGVSTGIGRAAAARFARAGWRVVGTVRGPVATGAGSAAPPAVMPPDGAAPEEGAPSSTTPAPFPAEVHLETLDLADDASVAAFATRVLAEHGVPDVLVNNAGMLHFGSVEDTDPATMRHVFEVNVFNQVALIDAFLPGMRERGSGLIVNVTSLGGRLTFPFFATYNASKHALEGYSEGLWHELQPFGIRVKAVEPGYVATPIYGKAGVTPEGAAAASEPYRRFEASMVAFEGTIKRRSTPDEAAEELWRAVNDPSDRLRYPIAAYASTLLRARRWLGELRVMRVMHRRWMG